MERMVSYSKTRRLVESAVMIAVGTVLSLFEFKGPWALGGGITVCAMLPLVILSFRYGMGWGTFSAFVFSVMQMLLGIKNVQYASSIPIAVGIILLDYIFAYSAIGLASVFSGKLRSKIKAVVAGIVFTFTIRFICHFLSGIFIWEALWPNELGWAPWIWSFAYNMSYMLPEILITTAVAALLEKPLSKTMA